MGETDDEVAFLLRLEHKCKTVGHLGRVLVLELFRNCGIHNWTDICSKANDADLESGFSDDGVGFDIFPERSVREIIICTNDRHFEPFQTSCQCLDTIVKLVISNGNGIETEVVQEVNLDFPFKNGEIGSTLSEIARVEQQHVAATVGCAHAVDICSLFNHPAPAIDRSRPLGVIVAVSVVQMEYGEVLG